MFLTMSWLGYLLLTLIIPPIIYAIVKKKCTLKIFWNVLVFTIFIWITVFLMKTFTMDICRSNSNLWSEFPYPAFGTKEYFVRKWASFSVSISAYFYFLGLAFVIYVYTPTVTKFKNYLSGIILFLGFMSYVSLGAIIGFSLRRTDSKELFFLILMYFLFTIICIRFYNIKEKKLNQISKVEHLDILDD